MNSGEVRSLTKSLEAAKEKAALLDFDVTITETLKMTVRVKAADQLEAEMIVTDAWNDSKYILDADNFVGADFNAVPVERDRSLGSKGKEDFAR